MMYKDTMVLKTRKLGVPFIAELEARKARVRGWSPIAKKIYPSQKLW